MGITIDDIPILLPDAGGELANWLKLLHIDELPMCPSASTYAAMWQRPVTYEAQSAPTEAPVRFQPGAQYNPINYPPRPAPRVNSLYWPTGASRWTEGFFLFNKEQFDKLNMDQGHGLLVIHDEETHDEIKLKVWYLPPRTIYPTAAQDDPEQMILVHVVDVRWFWQFLDTGTARIKDADTWDDLLDQLKTALQITGTWATPNVPAEHYNPDFHELSRRYANAAVLLDVVCHSLGWRLTYGDDGTESVNIRDFEDDIAEVDFGWANGLPVLAGGLFDENHIDRGIPEQVRVVFPAFKDHARFTKQADHIIDVNASTVRTGITPPIPYSGVRTRKLIHSTAFADFTTGSPSNTSDLTALAQRIATDYFNSMMRRYDITYLGVVPSAQWPQTAFEDAMLICIGTPDDGPGAPAHTGYSVYTRVWSPPVNVWEEWQFSQFEGKKVYSPFVKGKTTEEHPKSSAHPVAIWVGDPGSEVDTGDEVEAYNTYGDLAITKWITLYHNGAGWDAIAGEC